MFGMMFTDQLRRCYKYSDAEWIELGDILMQDWPDPRAVELGPRELTCAK